MRIRKNRKVLALMFPGARFEPHVCLTNQYPLDTIPKSPNPDSAFDSCLRQFGRNSRFEREDNTNAIPIEREAPEEAAGKKVDGGDGSGIIIIEDSDENRTEKKDERKGKAVRPRSQRSAAKNPRWLNSKAKDFYYYDCD